MKIVAGLGNPGTRYETTRHNAGFLAIDRLVERWKARGPVQSHHGEIFEARSCGEKALLVKPQTFMNESGSCLGPLMKFYKCSLEDLVVLHDEIDLPFQTLRLKTGGGAGGHNGLKSIDSHLGSPAYHRIRIGVGRPPATTGRAGAADHVLDRFSDQELKDLDPLLDIVAQAVERILEGRMAEAMNEYNRDWSLLEKSTK